MKTTIELPLFPGFYNTIFECDCEENEIEEGKTYDDYNFDYKDYHERVSNGCCNSIETKLNELGFKCTVKFLNVVSPKFYNYSNDGINCEIDFNISDLNRLIKETKRESLDEFEGYLENHFKSRSGFDSFYEYDSETWFKTYLKKDYENFDLCLSHFLTSYLETLEFTSEDLYNSRDVETETCWIMSQLADNE